MTFTGKQLVNTMLNLEPGWDVSEEQPIQRGEEGDDAVVEVKMLLKLR